MRGISETRHAADLGDQHRPSTRPHAGQLLDRMIAAVGRQPLGDHRGKARFVAIKDVDQFQQRADALRVGAAQRHLRQALAAGHANKSGATINTPALASTAWICALSPDRIATSLAR